MCKYCDYLFDADTVAEDIVLSNFNICGVLKAPVGVYIGHKSGTEEPTAALKLYLGDEYAAIDETEVKFCPMCGKELKDLPEI